jgi:N-acylneuraminate cytidylyltransferase
VRRLAIVPARGGSKRIPRKNIRPFLGTPLLARTLAIVRASGVFDRVIVSTDDDEIASIAKGAGADVPFRRPEELSNDHAATIPVIAHAIDEAVKAGDTFEMACCVYPAAVLSLPEDYREAVRAMEDPAVDYAFTATSFPFPIQRALKRLPDGSCEMFTPEHRQTRSQDLEPAFHDAGQFYFGRVDAWREARPIFSPASRMLLLPRHRVQDIDTLEDWERAELLYQLLHRD